MPWQQLQFQAPAAATEELEQILLEHGAQSVTLIDAEDQAVFQTEPGTIPLWDKTRVCGLFEVDANLKPLLAILTLQLATTPGPNFQIDILEDQDWERAWMADFHPMQFGETLWICPHSSSPPDPDAVNIMLDPGLAFGTGTHATTSLCLKWLEQANIEDKLVIDYGCGSGVLGIAAALLGARKVIAVDNDPQAITATNANRDMNKLDENRLQCFLPEQVPSLYLSGKADILVANILAGPLHQLGETFSGITSPGASMILSGILPEQADALLDDYAQWFEMADPVTQDGWVRLYGSRRYTE